MNCFFRIISVCCLLFSAIEAGAQTTPSLDLWYWHHAYITNPTAVQSSELLIDQAVQDGYTGVVFWDSSFSFMTAPFWSAQNMAYLQQVMMYATARGLKVMATATPYGYSNDVLQNNPNWAESQRVIGTQFKVNAARNQLQLVNSFTGLANASFENGRTSWFAMGDAGTDVDTTVSHSGATSGVIRNAPGNARFFQIVGLTPWRQYHLRLFYKTENFRGYSQILLFDSGGQALRLNAGFSVSSTQNWTQVDYTFNSQTTTQGYLYFGVWGGNTGSMWFDDVLLEETGLVYVTRRPGTPVKVYDPNHPGTVYQEGIDYNYISDARMSSRTPFTDMYHLPTAVTLPAGTHLSPGQTVAIDSYSVFPMSNGQTGMCLTEAGTLSWLQRNAKAIANILPPGAGFFMQYDEMRQMNSCGSCRAKGMSAGDLLAWHVSQSVDAYQTARSGAPMFVWSDMFDPFHNAVNNYYNVEGDLSGSWKGLPADITVVNWNLSNLQKSLTWFSGLNPAQPIAHSQIIAGYYDSGDGNGAAKAELAQAAGIRGVSGLMYTTWNDDYSQLQNFATAAKAAWPGYVASLAPKSGTLSGSVRISGGGPLQGASVTITGSGINKTATTDGNGNYSIAQIPAGTYSVLLAAAGFTTFTNPSVAITAGQVTSVNVQLVPTGVFKPIRVNAGGSAFIDPLGNIWAADTNYNGGSTYSTAHSIANTTSAMLYQSERWSPAPLTYTFVVPNGIYHVNLKFAEIYFGAAGQRVFDVAVNGSILLPGFDITSAGGANTAVDRSFSVNVTNGAISIILLPKVENPKISAIEITAQ